MEQAKVREKPFLNLARSYPVAPEKVWRAWTDPEALKRWFGPGSGDPVSLAQLDVRVGGRYRIVFGGPKGTDHEVAGVYKEVVPNRKLAFTWVWPRTTPDRESLVTIVFEKSAQGTNLSFRHEQLADEATRDGHQRGWSESLVKLDLFLRDKMAEAMKPFEISRVFDIPRERMWEVWTEPRHLLKWWGSHGTTVTHLTNDLQRGGMMHYCLRMADGKELWGRFVYREIAKPERLTFENSFSDPKGGITRNPWNATWPLELVSTIRFDEAGPGKTRVTVQWMPAHDSTEAERKSFDDGRPGMTQGWGGTLDRLGKHVASI